MTGKKLFAGIISKKDQLHRVYNSNIPQLSAALAESLEEDKPRPSPSKPLTSVLENGIHPAARNDLVTSCHSVCMQQLMKDCLSGNPLDRPTADGVCGRLLICPGGMPQANYYFMPSVRCAAYCRETEQVVAIQEGCDKVTLIPKGTWQLQQCAIPYSEEKIGCLAVIGREVFFASQTSNLMFSFQLPSLQSGHISPEPLVGTPLCIIKQPAADGMRIIVGMSGGRLAVFSPPPNGGHILEQPPHLTQVSDKVYPQSWHGSIMVNRFKRAVVFFVGLKKRKTNM